MESVLWLMRGGRGEIRDGGSNERERIEIFVAQCISSRSMFFFSLRDFSPRRKGIFFSSACRLFTVHRRGQRRDMERIMQTWTRDKEFKVMAIEDGRFDKYTANTHFVPFSKRRGLRDRIKRYSIFRGMGPGSRIV